MGRQDLMIALEQLHRSLAVVRNLLAETNDASAIAPLLDKIEVLPQLIQQFDQPRARELFSDTIAELVQTHPYFEILDHAGDAVTVGR